MESARLFPSAGQPDVVLAAQKDSYYRREMRDQVEAGFEAMLEPHQAVALNPELKLVAECAYFLLTTARGRQTPGEEYCDILQVGEGGEHDASGEWRRTSMHLPGVRQRALLLLFGVIGPYVNKRVGQGGWKSLSVLFQKPKSAVERAADMRRRMLQRTQSPGRSGGGAGGGAGDGKGDGKGAGAASATSADSSYLGFLLSKRSWLPSLPWLLSCASFLYRAHLAAFYLRGNYYDWSKRIAGVRMAFTREPKSDRPTYAILGWFLVAQLAIESSMSVSKVLASIGRAWGILHNSSSSSSSSSSALSPASAVSQVPAAPDEVVPALPVLEDEDESAQELGVKDDAHMRGMENFKCGICLTNIHGSSNGAGCPPCGHLFCYEHIVAAISAKGECPICRKESAPSDVMTVHFSL